eukprot:scaffold28915_cov29-Tisochrysis_lutea.AAC.7
MQKVAVRFEVRFFKKITDKEEFAFLITGQPGRFSAPRCGPAWLLAARCSRGHAAGGTGVALACSVCAGGRGRVASDCSMGTGGAPSAGGPKEKRGSAARSWQPTIKLVAPTPTQYLSHSVQQLACMRGYTQHIENVVAHRCHLAEGLLLKPKVALTGHVHVCAVSAQVLAALRAS